MGLINGMYGFIDDEARKLAASLHESGDHYRAAIVEATGEPDPHPIELSALYWTACAAARYAAGEMLAEASRIGCTDDQWERLRQVAANVAED